MHLAKYGKYFSMGVQERGWDYLRLIEARKGTCEFFFPRMGMGRPRACLPTGRQAKCEERRNDLDCPERLKHTREGDACTYRHVPR
jgi:hypothetical protein